jgi:hypothetical protein
MDWDCPTWGCHGAVLVDGVPRHGQLAWCERWPGALAPTCGRRLRWDARRQSWFLLHRPVPHPDEDWSSGWAESGTLASS